MRAKRIPSPGAGEGEGGAWRTSAAIVLCALSASPSAAGPQSVVNNPTPSLSAPWRPTLENLTTASPHETVTEWHLGMSFGSTFGAAVKYLGANIIIPSAAERTRYLSNEVELELKAPVARAGSLTAAVGAFACRYWQSRRDLNGNEFHLMQSYYGPKIVADWAAGPLTPSMTLKGMRVLADGSRERTVAAAGLGLVASLPHGFQATGEWNPFIKNPLGWRKVWGAGIRWRASASLTLGGYATNSFGGLSPDSFYGSAFTQYRFEWSYTFN